MLKSLLTAQIIEEAAWATPLPPTSPLYVSSIKLMPKPETKRVEEMRGTLAPAYRSILIKDHGEANIEQPANYQDMALWLKGLFGADDGGAYAAPLEAVSGAPWYTLVHGTADKAYGLVSGVVSKFSLKGSNGEAATVKVDFIGHSVAPDALETLEDVETSIISGGQTILTIGETEIEDTAFSYELSIDTKRILNYRLGALNPVGYSEGQFDATLKISIEFEQGDEIIEAALAAVTAETVTIESTDGSNTFSFVFAGVLEDLPDLFPDVDGIVSADLEFKAQVDDALENWFTAQLDLAT